MKRERGHILVYICVIVVRLNMKYKKPYERIDYSSVENIADNIFFYQHIGIYGYRKEALEKFCNQEPSSLEKSEKLEQLRWLENGGKIKVGITKKLSYPVDTIEDLNEVRKIYEKKHHI